MTGNPWDEPITPFANRGSSYPGGAVILFLEMRYVRLSRSHNEDSTTHLTPGGAKMAAARCNGRKHHCQVIKRSSCCLGPLPDYFRNRRSSLRPPVDLS